MKRRIAAVLVLAAFQAHAQVVHKCVGKGGAVSYQSEPCTNGQAAKTWAATPEAPPTNAELWRRYYAKKRGEADSRYLRHLAGRTGSAGSAGASICASMHIEAHQTAAVSAEHGRRTAAEARLADAARLIEHPTAQMADLAGQRKALVVRLEALQDERGVLANRLQQQEAPTWIEREALTQHLRALEDRSHAEVNPSTQEAKALQEHIEAFQKEHKAQQQAASHRLDETKVTLAEALRNSASKQGRAEALKQQLNQLSELQATLRAYLSLVMQRDAKAKLPEYRSLERRGGELGQRSHDSQTCSTC